mmetsp:Transcript_2516/g.4328  ORF Transcript_2516/g.4328 Transcript_2516/m.4328 type:complete len:229 (+) Transcript_2516:210-896(+)
MVVILKLIMRFLRLHCRTTLSKLLLFFCCLFFSVGMNVVDVSLLHLMHEEQKLREAQHMVPICVNFSYDAPDFLTHLVVQADDCRQHPDDFISIQTVRLVRITDLEDPSQVSDFIGSEARLLGCFLLMQNPLPILTILDLAHEMQVLIPLQIAISISIDARKKRSHLLLPLTSLCCFRECFRQQSSKFFAPDVTLVVLVIPAELLLQLDKLCSGEAASCAESLPSLPT